MRIVGFISLAAGVLLVLTGLLVTPGFVASHFSPDGVLLEKTIQTIQLLRLLAACVGILAVAFGALNLIYPSRARRFFAFISHLGGRFGASHFYLLFIRLRRKLILSDEKKEELEKNQASQPERSSSWSSKGRFFDRLLDRVYSLFVFVSHLGARFKTGLFLSDEEKEELEKNQASQAEPSSSWSNKSRFFDRLFSRDSVFMALIVLYVALFMFQFNLPVFERYPGWDEFWVDTRTAGGLLTLKEALLDGELPAISPYEGFGFNFAGNTSPTSPLSPFNLLILVFSPATVMVLRTVIYFMLGAIGGYLFLRLVTHDRFLSLLGGLTYISIPFVLNMHFYGTLAVFLLIPLFLLLIHKILERPTPLKYLLFVALCVLEFAAGEVHTLIILPTVVAGYSLVVGYGYYRLGFLNSMKPAAILTCLCVLSASFYIVPLYNNLHEISSALNSLKDAGLLAGGGGMGLAGFLSFFQQYGLESLYKPFEGSGLLLYVPVFFYFGIVMALALHRMVFRRNPRQVVIPVTLLLLGLGMFLISVLFYSLPWEVSGFGRGVLRGHINLIPFMVVLAGFICFAAINRLKEFKKRIYIVVMVGPLLVDLLLFSSLAVPTFNTAFFDLWHVAAAGTRSSNLVSVRFLEDMRLFLPWLNLMFVMLLFSHSFIGYLKQTPAKKILYVGFIACALLLPLLSISVHNDLRATTWFRGERNPYRWETYIERKACIDGIIAQYDKNYRTLPASENVYEYAGIGRGRNWKLIAETELHIQDRQKMLFSYRETMHPYTGLLYSTFHSYLNLSNWFPPTSKTVAANIDIIRLMGVRWVTSADATLNSADLIYRGECVTRKAPPWVYNIKADGTVYIYEMRDPLRIAFLTDEYQVVNLSKSLKTISENKEHPWSHGVVYLETEPAAAVQADTSSRKAFPNLESSAEIVNETFNSVEVNVSAPATKYLVLSYLYRPNWSAYLGLEELTIYRAYGGFMAVEVPPGNSTITFRYTPLDVYLGLLLSVLAFALPLGAQIVRCYRRRHTEA